MSWKLKTTTSALAAVVLLASVSSAGAVEPVKLRWASDHSGPPHPAAIAEIYMKELN